MSERLADAKPLSLAEARALATAADRAKTLEADGYEIIRWATDANRFWVKKPDSTKEYLVNLRTNYCGCKFWESYRTCKHLLAVVQKDVEDRQADDAAAWARDEEWGRAELMYA